MLAVPKDPKKPDDRQFKVGDRVTVSLSAGRVVEGVVKAVLNRVDGVRLQVTTERMRLRSFTCGRCARTDARIDGEKLGPTLGLTLVQKAAQTVRKLRRINGKLDSYEPEGREFESLRARHFS